MKFIVQPTFLAGWLAVFACTMANAQTKPKSFHSSVEAGTYLSTGKANPFWIRSNQYGEIPLEASGFTVRAQLKKEYDSTTTKRISFGYGGRAIVNTGAINQLLVSELYGKLRYRAVEFSAGRRREIMGLVDPDLSAGSFIWSGNALPIPKVQISIPNYTPILKNGLIAIKGNYAHGWFGTGDSVQNYFLHQKSLYVRVGKPDWRFKFHAGFNHQVQWGGTLLYPRRSGQLLITKFGTDLKTYGYVVSGQSLYADDDLVVQDGQASSEGGNRVGNHVGSLDIAVEYEDDQSRFLLYRQSFYEAGALYYLNNISDGLTGLSFARKHANSGLLHILVEYLHTSSQGGPYTSGRSTIPQLRGNENYFNNGRYIDGWVYKGQTIGTPFIMPLRYTNGLPQTLAANPNLIVNNRVNALTLSAMSRVRKIDLLTRVSVSENLGNYKQPLNINQLSLQQQIIVPVNDYFFTTTLAYDNAGVLQQNLGLSFFVRRNF